MDTMDLDDWYEAISRSGNPIVCRYLEVSNNPVTACLLLYFDALVLDLHCG